MPSHQPSGMPTPQYARIVITAGTAEIGSWDAISLRADPYELGGIYDQRSPLTHIRNARTPTLILHGADDNIVPASQSYELFRALKDQGVPTELVIYPREPHGFREREVFRIPRLPLHLRPIKRRNQGPGQDRAPRMPQHAANDPLRRSCVGRPNSHAGL